jgi:predicted RND superfamily exporter protein
MTHLKRHWLWLLLAAPIVLGLWRLRFDVEVLNLLPDRSPVVQGIKLYQQNFANARELIITLQAPDADTAESSARAIVTALRARKDLIAEATWTPPWIEHPGQAAELMAFLWLNQPPAAFADLTNRLQGTRLASTLAEAREALATSLSPNDVAMRGYDPLNLLQLPGSGAAAPSLGSGSEYFASSDGTFRILFAEASTDLVSYKSCIKWFDEVKHVVEGARASGEFPAEVIAKFTGRPAFVAEIGRGMERDLAGPSVATLAVIALLFYFTHRCWRPLVWLLTLLVLILAGTLALGGLVYGTLNVVSLGFASILLGLAEDFGIVLYQESQTHPHHSLAQIRREAMPGIVWSAVTTAGAFLLLNLSGLPGLGQLGTLVAIGVAVAAFVMLAVYLAPLLDLGARRGAAPVQLTPNPVARPMSQTSRVALPLTAAVAAFGMLMLWQVPPQFDQSPDTLKPRNSQAYAALDEIKVRLNRPKDPLWVIVAGGDEGDIRRRLTAIEPILRRAVSDEVIAGFTLPTSIWPHAQNQAANRDTARALAARAGALSQAVLSAGFTTNSLGLTTTMLGIWSQAAGATNVFWPTNDNSRWILEKLVARTKQGLLAVGLLQPHSMNAVASFDELSALSLELQANGVWLSGWEMLGPSVSKLVRRELWRVLLPILGLVLLTLWLAFRSWRDAVLSLATLAVSGLALHLVMVAAGWSWNMMNLMALPLLLGMGVDFSIHIQLALRRHQGDLAFVRRSVGRALLLAGSTTVAGFASLSFASNAGIAALGKVCAVGIICAMLAAVYLLPTWWQRVVVKESRRS